MVGRPDNSGSDGSAGAAPPAATGDEAVPPPRSPQQELFESSIHRRLLDVERQLSAAVAAVDEIDRCCGWMAAERQLERFVTALQPYLRASDKLPASTVAYLTDYLTTLDGHLLRAGAELEAFDDATRQRAKARLGLRVAVVGKGGSGKTFVAGTLARFLAERSRRVLAADLDTNPGLSYTLGLGPSDAGLPDEALEEHPGADYGWRLAPHLRPAEVVSRFTTPGPDGLRFLGIGKIGRVDKLRSRRTVAAVRTVLSGFSEPGWDVIGDLEGGLTTPFERYHSFADLVLIVVGPSWVSSLTARRLLTMVDGLPVVIVANRVPPGSDLDGFAPALYVPPDPEVGEAERVGLAPFDLCRHSPAVTAIGQLADLLTTEDVRV